MCGLKISTAVADGGSEASLGVNMQGLCADRNILCLDWGANAGVTLIGTH